MVPVTDLTDLIAAFLLLTGSLFLFIGALGVVRMPDVYCRMHATTKSGSLGAGLMLLAAAFHFEDVGITVRALATVAFILLTAPVGAHLLARASYSVGRPMWEGRVRDELQEDLDTPSPPPQA